MDKHNVRKGVDITFADDVTRTIYPLTIKSLRKFVKVIERMKDLEDMSVLADEDIDTMMDAAEIILAKVDPGLASNRETLEDVIDLEIFQKMMGVAMGASSPEE